ncbi:MAG: PilZ domain-containing protein [Gemmataceae bacterium]|nr:PilZ domain-containing protein [Gemmataceae bacterium]MCI0738204.1 PilZ domain-containing protein [Gemmataceae bacterium]
MSDPRDRRNSERFPVTGDTTCPFAGKVQDIGLTKIKNVSMEGIGLVLSKPVEVGSLLAITIVNKAKSFHRVTLVKVAHVTPQGGHYLVGGTFDTALSYQDLTALVM